MKVELHHNSVVKSIVMTSNMLSAEKKISSVLKGKPVEVHFQGHQSPFLTHAEPLLHLK